MICNFVVQDYRWSYLNHPFEELCWLLKFVLYCFNHLLNSQSQKFKFYALRASILFAVSFILTISNKYQVELHYYHARVSQSRFGCVVVKTWQHELQQQQYYHHQQHWLQQCCWGWWWWCWGGRWCQCSSVRVGSLLCDQCHGLQHVSLLHGSAGQEVLCQHWWVSSLKLSFEN